MGVNKYQYCKWLLIYGILPTKMTDLLTTLSLESKRRSACLRRVSANCSPSTCDAQVALNPPEAPLASELEGPRRAVPPPTVTDRKSFMHAGPPALFFFSLPRDSCVINCGVIVSVLFEWVQCFLSGVGSGINILDWKINEITHRSLQPVPGDRG